MNTVLGLQVNEKDNVATIFNNETKKETLVRIIDQSGKSCELQALADIPFGHKIALKHISIGEPIIKYGQVIGVASADIVPGQYVHIHNLESCRGRGDLEKKEE